MVNASSLLSELQRFLQQRGVDASQLSLQDAAMVMMDWFRLVPMDPLDASVKADVLVFQHAGWSEGCATGYKLSVMRRVTETPDAQGETDWYAGITVMYEPSRFAGMPPFKTESTDWPSLEAFLHAIESSAAWKTAAGEQPMGVIVESGGLR